jgi:hypothetical protein
MKGMPTVLILDSRGTGNREMDKITNYRSLVKRLLSEFAALCDGSPNRELETLCIFDEERDHYLLMSLGWTADERVMGITVYVRLRNGRIWIEEDMTEDGITPDLLKAGVPNEDIVLAFQHPEMRPLTDFAVA